MSTWVCACICFSFVPEMIERMKVWYVIEFWHKCTEGLKNLIRISSIRNNKKYLTIKKIFEAGDFYAILSDIVEKISNYKKSWCCPHQVLNWPPTDSWKCFGSLKKSPPSIWQSNNVTFWAQALTLLDWQIDGGNFRGGPKHFQESVGGQLKPGGRILIFFKWPKKLHPYCQRHLR